MIELLAKLEKVVPLSELVKAGIIDSSIVRNRDIYFKYKALRISGLERMEAYAELSTIFGLSTIRIIQILSSFK